MTATNTSGLTQFRERLLTELASLAPAPAPVPARSRRLRRGPISAIVIAVAAGGTAIAVTVVNRLRDVTYYDGSTQQTPTTSQLAPSLEQVATAINRDPASKPPIQAAQLKVVAEATTTAGHLQVVMGTTAPRGGGQAPLCQALTVNRSIRNAGCTFVAPGPEIWNGVPSSIDAAAGDTYPPGVQATFPQGVPNVAMISLYVPRSAVRAVVRVKGRAGSISGGVVNGVFVTLLAAEDVGLTRWDATVGMKAPALSVEALDGEGKLVYQVRNLGF